MTAQSKTTDHELHSKSLEWAFRILLVALPATVFSYVYVQMNQVKDIPVLDIQEITLIEEIPKPEEPEEEPEPIVEEVVEEVQIEPIEMEESVTDDVSTDDSLGLDGDGEAGLDSFGLKAKKGGRSLLDGSDGGGRNRAFDHYSGQLEKNIRHLLNQYEAIRQKNYSIKVSIWIASDGHVEQLKLDGTTGEVSLDSALKDIFNNPTLQLSPPPDGLPQPVRLRIRSSIGIG